MSKRFLFTAFCVSILSFSLADSHTRGGGADPEVAVVQEEAEVVALAVVFREAAVG